MNTENVGFIHIRFRNISNIQALGAYFCKKGFNISNGTKYKMKI